MSITQLATYPSHLIRRALKLVDPRSGIQNEALEYLQREEVSLNGKLNILLISLSGKYFTR